MSLVVHRRRGDGEEGRFEEENVDDDDTALLLFVVGVFEQAMGKGTWQRSWIKSLAGFLFGVAARPVVPTVILDTKLQRRLSEAVVP